MTQVAETVLHTYPASLGQRIWVRHYLNRSGREPLSWTLPLILRGALDREALLKAVFAVIQRHEILRTTLHQTAEQTIQKVHGSSHDSVEVLDLSNHPKPENHCADIIGAEVEINRGPLFQVKVVKVGEETHFLAISAYEAICDGPSRHILLREISHAYSSLAHSSALPTSPVLQYGQFALWQAKQMGLPYIRQQGDYWRRQWREFPEYELGLLTKEGRERSFLGTQIYLSCSGQCRQAVATIAAQREATLFMVLLATVCSACSLYTRQKYIILGSTGDYREQQEFGETIGLFTSTLRFCIEISDDPPFVEVIDRCRAAALEAYRNQDFPLELAIHEIQPERNFYSHPPFQVKLVLQEQKQALVSLPDLQVDVAPPVRIQARYDLVIALSDDGQSFSVAITYDRLRLQPRKVEAFAFQWRSIVLHSTKHPHFRISELGELTSMVPAGS